jgi:hypothetical protein
MEPETVQQEQDNRISTLFFQGNMSARFQGVHVLLLIVNDQHSGAK